MTTRPLCLQQGSKAMTHVFFDHAGNPVSQGRVLGQGGEGTVFEVRRGETSDLAGKVYSEPIPYAKQQKIREMVADGDCYLREIAAWPLDTLHATKGGEVVGFLMQKLSNHQPIHSLYGPAHRKQVFPKADYAFLVHVARNVAAAFDAVHYHGHVIGDVNQGNLVVASDGRVKLIDCDSFQIHAHSQNHLCGVGVPIFTPPELQSLKTFEGVIRSPNHDNFGLALFVFHLLQMGRHPFSGVFNKGKGDMPLRRAIAEFRFAYSFYRQMKQMDIPPSAVPLDVIPLEISALFELAFSEKGASEARPTASEWVAKLDVFRQSLMTCGAEPVHKFSSHLTSCPWCEIEEKDGTIFFVSQILISTPEISSTSIAELWSRIKSVPLPVLPTDYSPPTKAVKGTPPAPKLRIVRWAYIIVMPIIWASLVVGVFTLPSLFILWVVLAVVINMNFHHPYRWLRTGREEKLDSITKEFDKTKQDFKESTSTKPFTDFLNQLEQAKQKLDTMESRYQAERKKLQDNLRNKQLHRYLEGFFISRAKISGIGINRLAVLESFGVETAADIVDWRIHKIPGFGSRLSDNLLAWRKQIEAKFIFNPKQSIDPRDEQQLRARFNQEYTQIKEFLQSGHVKLQQISREMHSRALAIQKGLDQKALDLEQARADVKAVDGW